MTDSAEMIIVPNGLIDGRRLRYLGNLVDREVADIRWAVRRTISIMA